MLRLMQQGSTPVGMGQIQIPVGFPQIDHGTQYWMQFTNLSTG